MNKQDIKAMALTLSTLAQVVEFYRVTHPGKREQQEKGLDKAIEQANLLSTAVLAEVEQWPDNLELGPQPPAAGGETVLEEAQRLTGGDRRADYGHPIDDFTRTGVMWGAILDIGRAVEPEEVGLCMAALKISRQVNKPKRDNLVDGAGYLRTVEMVIDERERRATGERG